MKAFGEVVQQFPDVGQPIHLYFTQVSDKMEWLTLRAVRYQLVFDITAQNLSNYALVLIYWKYQ